MNVSNLLHTASSWVTQSRAFNVTQLVAYHCTPNDTLSCWKLDIWHKNVPLLFGGGLAEPAHQPLPKHLARVEQADEPHHHLSQLADVRRERYKVDIRAVAELVQPPCSVYPSPSVLALAHQYCRRIPHSTDVDFTVNRRRVSRYADQADVFRVYDSVDGELLYMNEWDARHSAALALQARTQNRELLVDVEVRYTRSALGLRRSLDSFHVIGTRRQGQQHYGTRLSEAPTSHWVPRRRIYGRHEAEGFGLCSLLKLDRFANRMGEQLIRDGWFDYGAWLTGLHDITELGAPTQHAEAVRKTRPNWKRTPVSSLGMSTGLMPGSAYMRL